MRALNGLTYTPTANFNGSDTLNISVTDADGHNVTKAVSVAVTRSTTNRRSRPIRRSPSLKAAATRFTLNGTTLVNSLGVADADTKTPTDSGARQQLQQIIVTITACRRTAS